MNKTIAEKLRFRTWTCLQRYNLPMDTAEDMLQAGHAIVAKKIRNAGLGCATECYYYAGLDVETIHKLLGGRLEMTYIQHLCKQFSEYEREV